MNKTMKMMNGVKKMALAALVLLAGIAQASPASAALKYGHDGVVAVAEKVGLKTAAKKAAVRGGAEFAAFKAAQKATETAVARVPVASETVKTIRPGQILAVGGAVAAVEGTHQFADGAQNALKCAGEAIKQDPQAAGKVVEGVFKPAGIALALVVLVGAGMLIWMVFPLIRVLRDYLATRKRRPAAASSTMADDDAPEHRRAPRSGFTRVETIVAVAGFLLLTVIGIRGCLSDQKSTSTAGNRGARSAEHQAARQRLAALKDDYHAALARRYELFKANVRPSVERAYAPVMGTIPSVTARYSAFGKLTHIVKTMVVDKLCKRNETGREIEADLQSCYYPAVSRAQEQSMKNCLDLANALGQERAKYIANVRELQVKIPDDLERDFSATLETSAVAIDQVQQKLASAQTAALIGSAVEVACVRATINTVSKFLGKIVARQAATMAASVGVSLADGPLPFGEIAGVVATLGCTAWSAWDIYKACKVVPGELHRTLVQATHDCREASIRSVNAAGEAIYSAFYCE